MQREGNIMSESKKLDTVAKENLANESTKHPHPKLMEKEKRLFQDRMNSHEEMIFQELLKRAIK